MREERLYRKSLEVGVGSLCVREREDREESENYKNAIVETPRREKVGTQGHTELKRRDRSRLKGIEHVQCWRG